MDQEKCWTLHMRELLIGRQKGGSYHQGGLPERKHLEEIAKESAKVLRDGAFAEQNCRKKIKRERDPV